MIDDQYFIKYQRGLVLLEMEARDVGNIVDDHQLLETLKNSMIDVIYSIKFQLNIEIHFKGDHRQISYDKIHSLISTLYNLFEPEHSQHFPLFSINVLIPQILDVPSSLITHQDIQAIFVYSKQTINELLQQRQYNNLNELDVVELNGLCINTYDGQEQSQEEREVFKVTCLGGTFDHLHSGHKLMLTCCLLMTDERIVVGISGDELLLKKSYAGCLDGFQQRKTQVEEFIKQIHPRVTADIHEIHDPVGPAGTDPDLQMLMLTMEVEKAIPMIDKARYANKVNQIQYRFVDLIQQEGVKSEEMSSKTSSTFIRKFLDDKMLSKTEETVKFWSVLMDNIGISDKALMKEWFSRLRDIHCLHWRYYIDIRELVIMHIHIHQFFQNKEAQLVELAMWFHKSGFCPRSYQFKHDSANIFREFHQSTQVLCQDDFEQILRMLHMKADDDLSKRFEDFTHSRFVQVQLTSLLGDSAIQQYKQRQQETKIWHASNTFRTNRGKYLKSILNKERIFLSDQFFDKYEQDTRIAIEEQIKVLEEI